MSRDNNNNVVDLIDCVYLPNRTSLSTKPLSNSFPRLSSQAAYYVNYETRKVIVRYGTEQLLGYKPEEFSFEVLSKSSHQEEVGIIATYTQLALEELKKNSSDLSGRMFIQHRMKHKLGHFVHVERISRLFSLGASGNIQCTHSLLRAIQFKPECEVVKFKWETRNTTISKSHEISSNRLQNVFTQREIEILSYLAKGYNYEYISSQLFICAETIRSHKKKMMRKLGVSDPNQLVEYYHDKK